MTEAFINFTKLCDQAKLNKNKPHVVLDCANGVGAIPMEEISKTLEPYIKIEMINTNTNNTTILNEKCGAEYIHKDQIEPTEMTNTMPERVACFDGDADRLIYFKRGKDAKKTPDIIDGDK